MFLVPISGFLEGLQVAKSTSVEEYLCSWNQQTALLHSEMLLKETDV